MHSGIQHWREAQAGFRGEGGYAGCDRMVKLTAELIEQAAQYTNAVRDRELDLRGELGGAQAVSRRAAGRSRPRRVRGGWSLARGPPSGPGVPPMDGPAGLFGAVC